MLQLLQSPTPLIVKLIREGPAAVDADQNGCSVSPNGDELRLIIAQHPAGGVPGARWTWP